MGGVRGGGHRPSDHTLYMGVKQAVVCIMYGRRADHVTTGGAVSGGFVLVYIYDVLVYIRRVGIYTTCWCIYDVLVYIRRVGI